MTNKSIAWTLIGLFISSVLFGDTDLAITVGLGILAFSPIATFRLWKLGKVPVTVVSGASFVAMTTSVFATGEILPLIAVAHMGAYIWAIVELFRTK